MSLSTECLAHLPMSADAVQVIYNMRNANARHADMADWIRKLCLSHERLRAEVTGLEILLAERTEHA